MTAGAFTKAELRTIGVRLASLPSPGPRPLTAEETLEVNSLVEKTKQMQAELANTVERGRLVLSWRIPQELIPTGNTLNHSKHWQKKKWKVQLDDALIKLLDIYPEAKTNGSMLKRWLRATRYSPKRVDEPALDLLGFKLAVDSLKRCGVIADDDPDHIHREPRWEKCRPGEVHGLLEVFLVAHEQVAAADPTFVPIVQVVRTPGMFTKMLIENGRKT